MAFDARRWWNRFNEFPKTSIAMAAFMISEGGEGHIEYQGGYRKVTERFIQGCRRAAAAKEWLIFQ